MDQADLVGFPQRFMLGMDQPPWVDLSHLDVMVDIDDVLVPTIDTIHELAQRAGLHDGSVGPEWSGWEAYGCPPEDYWAIWTQFANSGGYVDTPPIPGTVEALRRLHWHGARIHLVTARGFLAHAEEIRAWTPEWAQEYAVPHASLTFARDKAMAMPEVLSLHGPDSAKDCFDYALDDSPKNTRLLRDAGVAGYLLTHHHNRADTDLPRVPTVGDFVDLIIEEHS